MKSYPGRAAALLDALRLASGMTYKFAVPNIPRGGGKAVIDMPANFDPDLRPALLQRYGALVRQLNGLFLTGPEVCTSPAAMDIISLTAAPFVLCRTPARGGVGDPRPHTALGVFTGIQFVCEYLFRDTSLQSPRVLVQGTGSIGAPLIQSLREAGATVLFNDVDEAAIRRHRDDLGLEFAPSDIVYQTGCDFFAPCALGGILNPNTIPQLKCRAVAGGANNQLSTPQNAERLREKGILYAPDYVIDVGDAMAVPGLEILGWSRQKAETEAADTVRRALRGVLEQAVAEGIATELAARRIAEDHLSRVM
jgi:leucine dehydrogenase